jgi:hypothetical protein
METGPAVFAGAAFLLFGAGLLLWTTVRVLHGTPVAQGVRPATAVTAATLGGVVFVALGVWFFGRM